MKGSFLTFLSCWKFYHWLFFLSIRLETCFFITLGARVQEKIRCVMATAKYVRRRFNTLFETDENSKVIQRGGKKFAIGAYHQSQELARQVSNNPMRGRYFEEFLSICSDFERAAKLPIDTIFKDEPNKSFTKRQAEFVIQFLMPHVHDNSSSGFRQAYVESLHLRLQKGDCHQAYFRLPVIFNHDHLDERYKSRARGVDNKPLNENLSFNSPDMAFAANFALALTVLMRDHDEMLSDGLSSIMIPHPHGMLLGAVRPVTDRENVKVMTPELEAFYADHAGEDPDTGQLFQKIVHGLSSKHGAGEFHAYECEEYHRLACEVRTFIATEDGWQDEKDLRARLIKLYDDNNVHEGLSHLTRLQMSGAGYTLSNSRMNSKVYSALKKIDDEICSDEWQVFAQTCKDQWEAKNNREREGFTVQNDNPTSTIMEAGWQQADLVSSFRPSLPKIVGQNENTLAKAIRNNLK